MSPPRDEVLILTGPPGSGKTTVARLLTARHERAVHLESDLFWHFITSGFIEPWKPMSHEQDTLVMEIVAEVAARYAHAGYFTVIDGIVSPHWFLEPRRHALTTAGLRIAYAILRPPRRHAGCYRGATSAGNFGRLTQHEIDVAPPAIPMVRRAAGTNQA